MKALNKEALQRLVADLGSGDWEYKATLIVERSSPSGLSREATEEILLNAENLLQKGRIGTLRNWVVLGILLTKGRILEERKLQDLYRPSIDRPLVSIPKVSDSLESLVEITKQAGLPTERLQSWLAFRNGYEASRSDESRLIDIMKSVPGAHGTILGMAEESFMAYEQLSLAQFGADLNSSTLIPEAVSIGASYVFASYLRTNELQRHSFEPTSTDNPDLVWALRAGVRLARLQELELKVFRFGYVCTEQEPTKFLIAPPDEVWGKAIELGYIRTQLRPATDAFDDDEKDAPTFLSICSRWHREFGHEFYKIATDGKPRLQMRLPEPVAKIVSDFLLKKGEHYPEDIRNLKVLCYELGLGLDEVLTFKLKQDLTLGDILHIGRIFRFLAFTRAHQLEDLKKRSKEIYFNSLVGATSWEGAVGLITAFGVDEEKARQYLDLFTWRMDQPPGFLDLQYTPFLRFKTFVCNLFLVHGHSNIVRNALAYEGRRIDEDGHHDPLGKELEKAIRTHTENVMTGVPFSFSGLSGDIDVVTYLDGILFVFECKNVLHPCSAFEQRTLFDHLNKAAQQLDRLESLWQSPEFRKYLSDKLKFGDITSAEIRLGVVLSTRVLSGATYKSYPVRHCHELGNFITTGESFLHLPDKVKTIDMWGGLGFSGARLSEFLNENNPVYAPHWRSFHKKEERIEFLDCEYGIVRYGLNQLDLVKNLAPDEYEILKSKVDKAADKDDKE